MSKGTNNPYLPKPVTIRNAVFENDAKDIKTFELVFCNKADADSFKFVCGQFAMLSVFGAGESPIGIASSPLDEGFHWPHRTLHSSGRTA